MTPASARRRFIRDGAAAGALVAAGGLRFLSRLPPVEAAGPGPEAVRFRPEIEPIVRLLEDTPRERLLEAVAARLRAGLTYKELVAALLLAGVRNIQPRPVGFKFHAVLVVNSAHLASLASGGADRWLPIFWALDYFKDAQARDTAQGDWTLRAALDSPRPGSAPALRAFAEAMDDWDEERADAAATALARSGSDGVFETLCRYGARDFRDIGHKAIYVANGWRTLEYVGWQHAEPVLRSLAYALLDHEGGNPARRDAAPDRPWRRNLPLAASLPGELRPGTADAAATTETLAVLRRGSAEEACAAVADRLRAGGDTQSLWDALLLGAGELLMRRPGIVSLHAVTTANALRHAFDASADGGTRKLLLLQAAAFMTLFRAYGDGARGVEIDRLEPLPLTGPAGTAVDEILADVSRDPAAAAGKVLSYLGAGGSPQALMAGARRLVFLKGRDSHDYKLSSAVLEDYAHVSAPWRGRFLAAALFWLPGSGGPDNDLAQRTRDALGGA